MNWLALIATAGSFLGFAALVLWRVAIFYQRSLNEHESCREEIAELKAQQMNIRNWKHDTVNRRLHVLWADYENRTRPPPTGPYRVAPPSYSDLEDSRVTEDPRKEPVSK